MFVFQCVCVCVRDMQLSFVQRAFTESASQLNNVSPTISNVLTDISSVAGGVQGAIGELLTLASVSNARPVSHTRVARACACTCVHAHATIHAQESGGCAWQQRVHVTRMS